MLSGVGTKLLRSTVGRCVVSGFGAGRHWSEGRTERHCDDTAGGRERSEMFAPVNS
jgi:hypothetical protein